MGPQPDPLDSVPPWLQHRGPYLVFASELVLLLLAAFARSPTLATIAMIACWPVAVASCWACARAKGFPAWLGLTLGIAGFALGPLFAIALPDLRAAQPRQ